MTGPRIARLDKNYIQNGGFDYWERNVSHTDLLSSTYKADRYEMFCGSGSVGTILRTLDAPGTLPKLKYCAEYNLTSTSANAIVNVLNHKIEDINARDLVNKNASLSFYVKTVDFTDAQFILNEYQGAGTLDLGDVSINDDGNWNNISFENFVVPSWAINGAEVLIYIKNGSGTGVTNFKITGIKLNIGTKAQEFSLFGRDTIEELRHCSRMYRKSYGLDVTPGTAVGLIGIPQTMWHNANLGGAAQSHSYTNFEFEMRVAPVTTYYDGNGNVGKVTLIDSGASETHNHSPGGSTGFSSTKGIGLRFSLPAGSNGWYIHYEADSEM